MSSLEQRLQAENRRLHEERETLEERIRQLEEALRPARILPPDWKLSAQETRFVLALLARDLVPNETMNEAIKISRDAASHNLCHVVAKHVRDKLQPFGIEVLNLKRRGFALRDRLAVKASLA